MYFKVPFLISIFYYPLLFLKIGDTLLTHDEKWFLFHVKSSFKFFSWLFAHAEERHDKKAKAIFKIYGVPQNGEQIITMYNIVQYLMQ